MPSFTYKEVIKRVKKCGFIFLRDGKGSHEFWVNAETGKKFMIPKHLGKDLSMGTLNSIIKKMGFKNIQDFQNFK